MKGMFYLSVYCILYIFLQNKRRNHELLTMTNFQEETSSKFVYCEEAMEAVLASVTCEENSATEALSAFILSNFGGTCSWSGEPYTIPWLLKKAGLTSLQHKNMIKNVDFSDQCLQVFVL